MSKGIGQRVRLRLLDPDAGYARGQPKGEWPVVTGRLVAAVQGLYGKIWYLLKLEQPLPSGFDPLEALPFEFRSRSIRYLLLSPAPSMPTAEVPEDLIGECIFERKSVHVLVSIAEQESMPPAITLDEARLSFPGLCAGELHALSED